MQQFFAFLPNLFGRGGGGGSGGGSGGGAGGIFVLLGYVPAHYYGVLLHKKLNNPLGVVLMVIGTLLYATPWMFLGGYGIFVGLLALVGGPAGYFGWFSKVSAKMRKKASVDIAKAASQDSAWDQQALTKYVTQVFYAYQQDWSTFNIERIKTYTTPRFAYHTHLMLAAIYQRSRTNVVENPKLIETFPVEIHDAVDNSQDSVTFYVNASAHDRLIENIDGQKTELFVDNSAFLENWRFVRNGNAWLLDGIDQYTNNQYLHRPDIEAFAAQNGLYYSPDWGWLLLPRRGQLFSGGKFGKSDINNHAIGMYKNVLIELYAYLPKPLSDSRDKSQFIIAQAALPKRYESIIVEAREGGVKDKLRRTPSGYNALSLEWPDFNRRYRVFATNVEQVTAFELLHPVYMEKLFALPFKVSIEVVDNVVYLYTKDKNANYATMYALLKDAFEEMKL
jgi:hypothetical protein